MLLFPYRVETLTARNPWTNLAIIAATSIVSILTFTIDAIPEDTVSSMVLNGWHANGLLGHMLLHAGWMHLIGNMLMLYVFGNAVCGIMGQAEYFLLYLGGGLLAGVAHLLIDGTPAIGASGAISGIMGVYLAVYPVNRIEIFWMFWIRFGTFSIPGWVVIGGYFVLDLLGAFVGHGGTAYWAHIGGTVAGFGLGLVLLKYQLVIVGDYDNPTALDYFTGRAKG
jgi:membrane associated rhomboid family serine protease